MRERELERAEVAKISLQADRAENALSLLKKEAAQVLNIIIYRLFFSEYFLGS